MMHTYFLVAYVLLPNVDIGIPFDVVAIRHDLLEGKLKADRFNGVDAFGETVHHFNHIIVDTIDAESITDEYLQKSARDWQEYFSMLRIPDDMDVR